MNKTTVILTSIVVLAGMILAGCETKPNDVAAKAAQIADFSVPEGYQPEMAAELAGYTLAMYNPGDGHSHLYLVQASKKDVSQDDLEKALGQSQAGKKDRYTRLTVIDTREVTIRGEKTTLVISEGTNGDGDSYRQATAAFQGKGGPALLVMSEPISRWDDARIDQLIRSIQ